MPRNDGLAMPGPAMIVAARGGCRKLRWMNKVADLRFRKLWLAIGWALVVVVVYLSVGHVDATPDIRGGDKLGHVIAYSTIALWFMQIVQERGVRAAVCLGLICMGVSLEFVQAMLPYRDFELLDMAANTIGVLFGWSLAPPRLPNILTMAEGLLRFGK
jgi:VanZ family protein